MSKLVAVEWDGDEARVAVAGRRGADAVLEQVFSVPLPNGEANGSLVTSDIGRLIADALNAQHVNRGECIMGIGRSGVELQQLSLPPVPDDELPQTVRLQALRQFSSLGDDWPLDFLPLDADPRKPRKVLAAAVSPPQMKHVQQVAVAAGLRPRRLVLRSCAAASLFSRQAAAENRRERVLMVESLCHEIYLTAVVEGQVVYTRTARLPENLTGESRYQLVTDEVRRTLAAIRNRLGESVLDAIVLCGSPSEHQVLEHRLRTSLELPVRCFDPFQAVSLNSGLGSNLPDGRGRYGGLLGMLLDECHGRPPALDFLNPRQQRRPPSRRRLYVLAAAAVMLMAAGTAALIWTSLNGLDRQILRLEGELASLQQSAEVLDRYRLQAAALDQWASSDPTWLDEFFWLAERFPAAESARLTRLEIRADENAGSRMQLQGYVDRAETIDRIEQALRGEHRSVFGAGGRQDNSDTKYPWAFDAQVEIRVPVVSSEQ